MKRFGLFFIVVVCSSWLAPPLFAESFEIQLRSRSDRGIQYETEQWKADETLFVHQMQSFTSPRQFEMSARTEELLDHVKNKRGRIGASFDSVAEKVKNVVYFGVFNNEIFKNIAQKYSRSRIVLIRDLTDFPSPEKTHFEREKQIIELEKRGFATFSSTDLLGGQAFRYSDDKRPHLAVMVSDDHYKADIWLPVLMEEFGQKQDWYLTVLHGEGGASFRGMDELETVDSLIVYVRRLALPKDQLARLREYVQAGRGLVGLRTASHAFHDKGKLKPDQENWAEFDHDVLGGNYHDHGKNDLGTDVFNVAEQADSSIFRNVKPTTWHSVGSLYFTDPITENATVYQLGSSTEQRNIPLTWTRLYGKTRVAYTALGHWNDVKEEAFRQVLLNLIQWSLDESE